MAEHNQFYRDFSNRQPFNNIACRFDETLAPVVVDDDYRSYLKEIGLDWNNVETWYFPGSKEKVPVAFIQVKADEKERAMRYFNGQVSRYLKRHLQRDVFGCLSIDDMLDATEDDGRSGFDPTGTTENEDTAFTEMVIDMLLTDLGKMDPRYEQIFRLLLDGYKKGEILEKVDLGVAKTQGYHFIKQVQNIVGDVHNKYYK